ncbi:MAG: PEP-CTERM sorting domain-containing protein [Planctomycetes bacterium]|nr:PEP-CTERM sorting domain-containing protein [Planctomycetota bacterium]
MWTGPAGGGNGQNLEGLTLGPRLPNGDFILLGVVDDGTSDPLSSNTVVSLIATPSTAIPLDPETGDFNQDEDVDGADFLAWQRGSSLATLAGLSDGDGNRNGTVTGADLTIWENQYGTAGSRSTLQTVPEPTALALLLVAAVAFASARRGEK